jgi:hypothetical protein
MILGFSLNPKASEMVLTYTGKHELAIMYEDEL